MLRWMLLILTLAMVPPALAWVPYGDTQGRLLHVQQQGGQRGEPRGRPSRDREQAQHRQGERERNSSMTPDERRELNRDLQRANREFYRKGREGR